MSGEHQPHPGPSTPSWWKPLPFKCTHMVRQGMRWIDLYERDDRLWLLSTNEPWFYREGKQWLPTAKNTLEGWYSIVKVVAP